MKMDLTEALNHTGEDWRGSCMPDLAGITVRGVAYPITRMEPVQAVVHHVSHRKAELHVTAALTVRIPCDRCLEPVEKDFSAEETIELDIGDLQACPYLSRHQLLVDELLTQNIILQWPGKVLCREDCRGLCLICGKNLNEGECGCDRHIPDPRMAAFQDVFDQFLKSDVD